MPTGETVNAERGHGWLAGQADDIGWSNTLGCYEGLRLLARRRRRSPWGNYGLVLLSGASSADQQAAETFFAVRAYPNPRLLRAWARRPGGPTSSPTRAWRGPKTIGGAGSIGTEQRGLSLSVSAQTQRPPGMAS